MWRSQSDRTKKGKKCDMKQEGRQGAAQKTPIITVHR
jgi:hypothetical protein